MTQVTTVDGVDLRAGRARAARRRVAVVLEPGRRGAAVVATAAGLAASGEADVVVVAIAPQAESGGCAVSAAAYNDAVRDAVAAELQQARQRLGPHGSDVTFVMLVEGCDLPLPSWVAERGIELVMLPARRRLRNAACHPAAKALRQLPGVEVRVV